MAENFRGLLYAPSYEDEVIMLFGMVLPHLKDYRFEIEEYTDEFPDCNAKLNGYNVGIEFEVKASTFYAHKHHLDARLPNCGWIVCWKNDIGKETLKFLQKETKQPVEIKIITLSEIIEVLEKTEGKKFILNPKEQKHPVSKWVKETFLKQLKEKVEDKEFISIEELLEFCEKNKELEVVYGVGKIASLSVRVKRWGKIAPFGAMATGVVWISFKDANKCWVYPSQEIEAELRRRFNQPQTSYYKNYRLKDIETFDKIKAALEWIAEASTKS